MHRIHPCCLDSSLDRTPFPELFLLPRSSGENHSRNPVTTYRHVAAVAEGGCRYSMDGTEH